MEGTKLLARHYWAAISRWLTLCKQVPWTCQAMASTWSIPGTYRHLNVAQWWRMWRSVVISRPRSLFCWQSHSNLRPSFRHSRLKVLTCQWWRRWLRNHCDPGNLNLTGEPGIVLAHCLLTHCTGLKGEQVCHWRPCGERDILTLTGKHLLYTG